MGGDVGVGGMVERGEVLAVFLRVELAHLIHFLCLRCVVGVLHIFALLWSSSFHGWALHSHFSPHHH